MSSEKSDWLLVECAVPIVARKLTDPLCQLMARHVRARMAGIGYLQPFQTVRLAVPSITYRPSLPGSLRGAR